MAIGPISNHLTADHRRLEALLDAAQRSAPIDLGRYAEFRDGLLRHIAIEEKGAAARRPGSAQRHGPSHCQPALGRTITFQDIPVEPWRDGLLARGLPDHLVNHLATMADLHRAGRYDRMSDDVRMLTERRPLSVQEFVRKHAARFTASAK